MDVIVTQADEGTTWNLTDLLGRSMGYVTEAGAERFTIHPDGHALETMLGIGTGPFRSLDEALAEIEKHTRGSCRRIPDRDGS